MKPLSSQPGKRALSLLLALTVGVAPTLPAQEVPARVVPAQTMPPMQPQLQQSQQSQSQQQSQQSQPQPQPQQPSQVRLPALGESASDDFNLGAEKRLGEQIMRDIRRDPDYLDDPALLEYLQSIWQPLVQAARRRGDIGADADGLFPFESFLVRDRSVNAFALPGGYVGVHLGLMAMTATRDELASVLAHELSHVSQRHIARSISASSRSSMLGLAAMILGILAASRSSSPDAAQAVVAGSQAAVAQMQLNFSRDMEREADRSGQSLMSQAGFAATGMAAMFGKLDQANRLNDSGNFPYLRSHPLTLDRIGEAQQRAGQLDGPQRAGLLDGQRAAPPQDRQRPAPSQDSQRSSPLALSPGAAKADAQVEVYAGRQLWHALMQSRAKVLMDPSVDSLRRLQELDLREGSTDERMAGLYAGALASMQLRDFARADRAVATALALPGAREPGLAQRTWAQLATQLTLARGDASAAARLMSTLDDDTSRPALLLRAQVALASNDSAAQRRSVEALHTWVTDHRRDALAWQMLAQSAEAQGQPLRAVRAAAEAQAALGNLPGAIDRLRAGQQMARRASTAGADFIDASVIDSRLRDLQSQRRELLAEQRGNRRGSARPDGPGGADSAE